MTVLNLPAHLQNRAPSRMTEALGANLGGGSPSYVSIAGGRLTLIDASGAEEPVTTVDPKTGIVYLDCVIVDAGDHASKIYYGRPYDPNAQTYAPPDCWSDNGVAPSINASLPQARSCAPDPTGTAGCKWAVWGSATSRVSGRPVPACAKYQKLALLIPGDDVLFLLRVPPNSLDNLRVYNNRCRENGVSPDMVVTRVSFEKDILGTLTFEARTYIDQATEQRRQQALAQKVTDTLVGRGDQPRPDVGMVAAQTVALPQGQPLPLPLQQPGSGAPVAGALLPAAGAPTAATQASPSDPPAGGPTRRRRRNAAAEPAPNPPAGEQAAPFRQDPPPAQSAAGGQAQFGIVQNPGALPGDPAMETALNSLFGPR